MWSPKTKKPTEGRADVMSDGFWRQLLAPFMLLAMLVIAYPIKRLVWRLLPDGWLKSLLFRRLN